LFAVSTFYLLPPRALVGQQFARFLHSYFPELDLATVSRAELAEFVSATAAQQPDLYVIFREDLPQNIELRRTLVDDFGAEPGDEVVEVGHHQVQRWRLAG
jgi:hypothetical protein